MPTIAPRHRRPIIVAVLATVAGLLPFAPPRSHAAAPGDVGALLQAGAALRTSMTGTKAVTKLALPGSTDGLDIRPDTPVPVRPREVRRRLAYAGQAYTQDAPVEITGLRVTRREITVALGAGGYDPKTLQMPAPGSPGYREWNLLGEIERTSLGISWYIRQPDGTLILETPVADPETRLRDLEQSRLQATHERELAEQNARERKRHDAARTSGTRLHLRFRRDLTPADLTESRVREMLAPYLKFVE